MQVTISCFQSKYLTDENSQKANFFKGDQMLVRNLATKHKTIATVLESKI